MARLLVLLMLDTMATVRSKLNIRQLPMRYNTLGDSGLLVSELSFGCMMFHDHKRTEDAYAEMKLAYESGVNFFDNAEMYGDTKQGWGKGGVSERVMGAVTRGVHAVCVCVLGMVLGGGTGYTTAR